MRIMQEYETSMRGMQEYENWHFSSHQKSYFSTRLELAVWRYSFFSKWGLNETQSKDQCFRVDFLQKQLKNYDNEKGLRRRIFGNHPNIQEIQDILKNAAQHNMPRLNNIQASRLINMLLNWQPPKIDFKKFSASEKVLARLKEKLGQQFIEAYSPPDNRRGDYSPDYVAYFSTGLVSLDQAFILKGNSYIVSPDELINLASNYSSQDFEKFLSNLPVIVEIIKNLSALSDFAAPRWTCHWIRKKDYKKNSFSSKFDCADDRLKIFNVSYDQYDKLNDRSKEILLKLINTSDISVSGLFKVIIMLVNATQKNYYYPYLSQYCYKEILSFEEKINFLYWLHQRQALSYQDLIYWITFFGRDSLQFIRDKSLAEILDKNKCIIKFDSLASKPDEIIEIIEVLDKMVLLNNDILDFISKLDYPETKALAKSKDQIITLLSRESAHSRLSHVNIIKIFSLFSRRFYAKNTKLISEIVEILCRLSQNKDNYPFNNFITLLGDLYEIEDLEICNDFIYLVMHYQDFYLKEHDGLIKLVAHLKKNCKSHNYIMYMKNLFPIIFCSSNPLYEFADISSFVNHLASLVDFSIDVHDELLGKILPYNPNSDEYHEFHKTKSMPKRLYFRDVNSSLAVLKEKNSTIFIELDFGDSGKSSYDLEPEYANLNAKLISLCKELLKNFANIDKSNHYEIDLIKKHYKRVGSENSTLKDINKENYRNLYKIRSAILICLHQLMDIKNYNIIVGLEELDEILSKIMISPLDIDKSDEEYLDSMHQDLVQMSNILTSLKQNWPRDLDDLLDNLNHITSIVMGLIYELIDSDNNTALFFYNNAKDALKRLEEMLLSITSLLNVKIESNSVTIKFSHYFSQYKINLDDKNNILRIYPEIEKEHLTLERKEKDAKTFLLGLGAPSLFAMLRSKLNEDSEYLKKSMKLEEAECSLGITLSQIFGR